jgi:hypothetical protein
MELRLNLSSGAGAARRRAVHTANPIRRLRWRP